MTDDLISSLKSWAKQYDKPWKDDYPKGFRAGVFAAIEAVKELDDAPVRSGRWVQVRIVMYNDDGKPYTQFFHECSNCKWLNKHRKGWHTKFCPNCGADMREAEHETN